MSLYICDEKKEVVRHYCTDKKTEKAIETLLQSMENIVSSESVPGCRVVYALEDETVCKRSDLERIQSEYVKNQTK